MNKNYSPAVIHYQILEQREQIKKQIIELNKSIKGLNLLNARVSGGVVEIQGIIDELMVKQLDCFSYGKEMAREFLNLDFYFGIGGVLTFNNGKKLKEAAAYIPMDKILLETDCPYLAPVPYRGKRNNSTYLTYVVQELVRIKGLSDEDVIRITRENGRRLFGV